MRDSTLLFLIKRSDGEITDICLAMKKRGFGANRYNGVGGKVEAGESIAEATGREALEEIGVVVRGLYKVAELIFLFPHNPSWDQLVHVYFCEDWAGIPTESEEMNPRWFTVSEIPFQSMWPDDIFWLPRVLEGNFVKGRFAFGEGDVILEQEVLLV